MRSDDGLRQHLDRLHALMSRTDLSTQEKLRLCAQLSAEFRQRTYAEVQRLHEQTMRIYQDMANDAAEAAGDPVRTGAARQNSHLRLRRDGEYEGGERYRDWELLHGVPAIGGLTGDILREEGGDLELTPFRLLRGGRRIGSPEWWQVRHLFDGIPSWHTDLNDSRRDADVSLHEPHACDLTGVHAQEAKVGFPAWARGYGYLLAQTDIAETRVRRGDVIAFSPQDHAHDNGLVTIWLTSAEVEILRCVDHNVLPACGETNRTEECLVLDRRKWGRRKDGTTRFAILRRPRRSGISAPVRATSDDAALFELLAQVGGKMPTASADLFTPARDAT